MTIYVGPNPNILTLPQIVRSGLVLWLDPSISIDGTILNDISNSDSNIQGTLVGGSTFSPENNGVISLDGVPGSYINVPINLSLSSYTIMGASRYVTVGGRTFSAKKNNWLMGQWSVTTENYYAEGWVSPVQNGPGDTNWRIYAATGNPFTDRWELYVNGISKVGPNNGGSIGPNEFSIGSYLASSEWSKSQIGFLLCYNRVLTSAEIKQNYDVLKSRFNLI
jgi:hypothetical protein